MVPELWSLMLDLYFLGNTNINNILFHLYEVPKVVKFIEAEGRKTVARSWRENA